MTYTTVYLCANDKDLYNRTVACCSMEGELDPEERAQAMRWPLAKHPPIMVPYETAVLANKPSPGLDTKIISDAVLQSAVRFALNPVIMKRPTTP